MTEPGVLSAIASHKFLNGLSEQHRMLLASGARSFTAAPDELLAREGETAKTFYLIQAGHVVVALHTPDRGAVPVQTVGPGEIIGWSWLVSPHYWRFDCRAADSVQGLAFDSEWLREKCEQDHELGYQLLKRLVAVVANRLAATRVQLLDIYK
jgi:CRP/FNR family transcriptional regulator, cyclic AMP receptor protein